MWLAAEHEPAAWRGYRLAAGRLARDALANGAPSRLSPPVLRAAMGDWAAAGVPATTVALHVRTLKAALGWAFDERLIGYRPLEGMRGPSPPEPRRDVPVEVVRVLLAAAHENLQACATRDRSDPDRGRHTAEQVTLLLRLAADTGARRGELAALQLDDLSGRVLRIDRGVSDEVLTTTKTGRTRRLTVGAATAARWHDLLSTWQDRLPPGQPLGPWLFSPRPNHTTRLTCGTLGHWFADFVHRHGHPDVTLHRLRHTVATVLVRNGQLLHAQQRLGHAEASSTLAGLPQFMGTRALDQRRLGRSVRLQSLAVADSCRHTTSRVTLDAAAADVFTGPSACQCPRHAAWPEACL